MIIRTSTITLLFLCEIAPVHYAQIAFQGLSYLYQFIYIYLLTYFIYLCIS